MDKLHKYSQGFRNASFSKENIGHKIMACKGLIKSQYCWV